MNFDQTTTILAVLLHSERAIPLLGIVRTLLVIVNKHYHNERLSIGSIRGYSHTQRRSSNISKFVILFRCCQPPRAIEGSPVFSGPTDSSIGTVINSISMADPPITAGSRWIDLHPALLTYSNLRSESNARNDPIFRDTFMRYVRHHRGRARKLLDLWEAEPTRADEVCGKSRTLSFVKSLRAFLSGHDLMPERPPGWVDPLGVDQYEAMKEVRKEMHELKKIKDQKESVARRLDKVRQQLTTAKGPSGVSSDSALHANHPLVRSTGAQVRESQPTPQTSGQSRRNRNVKKRFFALEANNLRGVSGETIRRTMFPQDPDVETQDSGREAATMDIDQQVETTTDDQPALVPSPDQLPADLDPPMEVEVSESDQSIVEAGPSKKKAKRAKHKRRKQKKIKAKLMRKVYVMARRYIRENKIEVDVSESSSSGVSDGPSDLESEEDAPIAGHSRDRSSPARSSPARSSPDRPSPARSSPAGSSPDRSSPARTSPARSTPAQKQPELPASPFKNRQASPEPPRTPPLRRNATEIDPESGRMVQITDEHGRPMRRLVSPPGTNVILNYSGRPVLRLPASAKGPVSIKSRLGPRFVRPQPRFVRPPSAPRPRPRAVSHPQASRPQPSAADDEIEVVYKKHPEQVAQERWVAMMKRDQLRQAELAREKVPCRPAPRKQPKSAEQTEQQPTKKKFKPAATITFNR